MKVMVSLEPGQRLEVGSQLLIGLGECRREATIIQVENDPEGTKIIAQGEKMFYVGVLPAGATQTQLEMTQTRPTEVRPSAWAPDPETNPAEWAGAMCT